ncbi:hypothetical protein AWENTII_010714 [Aspergillus wentii]|nr:hypothetical protein MW887_009872 [Aspergillus wentii]
MAGSRRSRSLVISLLCLFLAPLVSAGSVCYSPDGTSESIDEYQQCNKISGTKSMCCATNRKNKSGGDSKDGFTADGCLPNGLCENVVSINNTEVTTYWREQCWSPYWQNGDCLNVCTRYTNSGITDDSRVRITPCDGTANSKKWCCGLDRSCCDTGDAFEIAATFTPGATTSATSTATSSTAPSTTTSGSGVITGTSTTEPQPDSSSGLSTGAKAGLGVGVAVGAITVLAILALFLRRLNKKSKTPGLLADPEPEPAWQPVKHPHEFDSSTVVHEVAGGPGHETHELSGEGLGSVRR